MIIVKDRIDENIRRISRSSTLDLSHLITSFKDHLINQLVVFPVWVGWLPGMDRESLRRDFSAFGQVDSVVTKPGYAFVGFVGFDGAMAALRACEAGQIQGPTGAGTVTATARLSVELVRRVLAALSAPGRAAPPAPAPPLPWDEVEVIADSIEDATKDMLPSPWWYHQVLRHCPAILAVGDDGVALPPTADAVAPQAPGEAGPTTGEPTCTILTSIDPTCYLFFSRS